jgi:hypothetical protein
MGERAVGSIAGPALYEVQTKLSFAWLHEKCDHENGAVTTSVDLYENSWKIPHVLPL